MNSNSYHGATNPLAWNIMLQHDIWNEMGFIRFKSCLYVLYYKISLLRAITFLMSTYIYDSYSGMVHPISPNALLTFA